jgi:hypothetical protein
VVASFARYRQCQFHDLVLGRGCLR